MQSSLKISNIIINFVIIVHLFSQLKSYSLRFATKWKIKIDFKLFYLLRGGSFFFIIGLAINLMLCNIGDVRESDRNE